MLDFSEIFCLFLQVSAASTDLENMKSQHSGVSEALNKLTSEHQALTGEREKLQSDVELLKKDLAGSHVSSTEKEALINSLRLEIHALGSMKVSWVNQMTFFIKNFDLSL